MAKKSSASRNSGAARRPQTSARYSAKQATLVRASGAAGPGAPERPLAVAKAGAPAAQTATRPKVVASLPTTGAQATKAAPRSTAAPNVQASRTQANRVARAQATQRARAANLISAEHYTYVLHDLRLTGILAAAMVLVIIILHFVLG